MGKNPLEASNPAKQQQRIKIFCYVRTYSTTAQLLIRVGLEKLQLAYPSVGSCALGLEWRTSTPVRPDTWLSKY